MIGEKTFYILRGLQGVGKSSLAADIARGNEAKIFSLDDYRTDPHHGYVYNKEKLEMQVIQMDNDCEQALQENVPMVIIDNTNYSRVHVLKYKQLAEKYEYPVIIIEIPHEHPAILAKRNVHGVPEERIRQLILRWDSIGYRLPFQRFVRNIKRLLKPWKWKEYSTYR